MIGKRIRLNFALQKWNPNRIGTVYQWFNSVSRVKICFWTGTDVAKLSEDLWQITDIEQSIIVAA